MLIVQASNPPEMKTHYVKEQYKIFWLKILQNIFQGIFSSCFGNKIKLLSQVKNNLKREKPGK